jgi:sulfur carrier protein
MSEGEADSVDIEVNGERRAITAGQPLAELLASLGLPPQAALVELNGRALLRAEWPAVELREGDRLEILRVVAGG